MQDMEECFSILRKYRMKLNPLKCSFGVGSDKFLGYIINSRGIEVDLENIKALIDMKSPATIKEVQSLTGRVAALSKFISKSTDKCVPFFNLLRRSKKIQWTEECEEAFQALKRHLAQPPVLAKPIDGETLFIYLAVTEYAISAALVKEDDRVQHPVYYISKTLIKA